MYHLVAEIGYDKASIAKIAEAVGIKKASIYYYFDSKESIFVAMVQNLFDDYRANQFVNLDKLTNQLTQEAYYQLGYAWIETSFSSTKMRKVFAEIDLQSLRIPELHDRVQRFYAQNKQTIRQYLQLGVDSGIIHSELSLDALTDLLYTILLGLDIAILYDMGVKQKGVWQNTLDLLFKNR